MHRTEKQLRQLIREALIKTINESTMEHKLKTREWWESNVPDMKYVGKYADKPYYTYVGPEGDFSAKAGSIRQLGDPFTYEKVSGGYLVVSGPIEKSVGKTVKSINKPKTPTPSGRRDLLKEFMQAAQGYVSNIHSLDPKVNSTSGPRSLDGMTKYALGKWNFPFPDENLVFAAGKNLAAGSNANVLLPYLRGYILNPDDPKMNFPDIKKGRQERFDKVAGLQAGNSPAWTCIVGMMNAMFVCQILQRLAEILKDNSIDIDAAIAGAEYLKTSPAAGTVNPLIDIFVAYMNSLDTDLDVSVEGQHLLELAKYGQRAVQSFMDPFTIVRDPNWPGLRVYK